MKMPSIAIFNHGHLAGLSRPGCWREGPGQKPLRWVKAAEHPSNVEVDGQSPVWDAMVFPGVVKASKDLPVDDRCSFNRIPTVSGILAASMDVQKAGEGPEFIAEHPQT